MERDRYRRRHMRRRDRQEIKRRFCSRKGRADSKGTAGSW